MSDTGIIYSDAYYLSGNSITVSVSGDSNTFYRYRLYYYEDIESFKVILFEGVVHILGGRVVLDFKDIIETYHQMAFSRVYNIALVDEDGVEYQVNSFSVYSGGVSRYFKDMPLTYIKNVLKNTKAMFFLTTRTRGKVLAIPENELTSLPYYNKGMNFTLFSEGIPLKIYDDSLLSEEGIRLLRIDELRKIGYQQKNKFLSIFSIEEGITIVVTTGRPSNGILIRFLNSLGAYEYVNLCGKVTLGSELSDEVSYTIDNRKKVLRRKRKYIASSFIYPINDDDRLWLNDLAHSNDVSISFSGNYFPVNVNIDTTVMLNTERKAELIPIEIEFADSESHFSNSQSELYRYLQTMDKVNVLDNLGNGILV